MERERIDFKHQKKHEELADEEECEVRGADLQERMVMDEATEAADEDDQLDLPPQVMKMLENVNALVSLASSKQPPLQRLASLWYLYHASSNMSKKQSVLKVAVSLGLIEKLKDVLSPSWDGRPLYRNAEFVLLFMALSFLYRVSLLPKRFLEEIATTEILEQLMSIVDFQGRYFLYQSKAMAYLGEVNSKAPFLVTQVVEKDVDEESLERLHQEAGDLLIPTAFSSGKIKVCELCNLEDPGLDVRASLIEKKLAWPRLHVAGEPEGVARPDKELFSENLPWHPIVITSVVNGGLFWAQVGENTFKQMEELTEKLRQAHQGSPKLATDADPGHFVLAKSGAQSCPLVRAQVMDRKDKSNRMTIFSVDFGHVRLIDRTEVFDMPPSLHPSIIPPLASLCCLPDVQSPPVNEDLLQMALCVLCNLLRLSKDVEQTLLAKGLPQLAVGLLSAPAVSVATQAARVLQQLTYYGLQNSPKFCEAIIDKCLALLTSNMDLTISARERLHTALLNTLANTIFQSTVYKKYLYTANGLGIVAKSLRGKHPESPSYKAAVHLFRNMIHTSGLGFAHESRQWRLSGQPTAKLPGLRKERASENLQLRRHTSDDGQPPAWSEAAGENRRAESKDMPAGASQSSEEACKAWIKKAVQESEHPPDTPNIKGLKLVQGRVFPYKESCVVALCSETKSEDVSRAEIARLVCSLLNTGLGGMIFFGIKEGMVEGIHLRKQQRDSFGLGVNQAFRDDISPALLHTQYCLQYVPVQCVDTMQNKYRDLCVPVITISPVTDRMVYNVRGHVFSYRIAEKSHQFSGEEVRLLLGTLEAKKYLKSLEEMAALLPGNPHHILF